MKIILASASPRRKELLTQIGIPFQVIVSKVEEIIHSDMPDKIVEELSEQKAGAVLESLKEEAEELLVIGADTIVSADGKVLGKPADEKEAKQMLRLLSGRAHKVYTGVTLYHRAARVSDEAPAVERKTFSEMTKVVFSEMTEEEIDEYVATKDPLDKAGAYGIQGFCARYIKGIEGDYNNVVGLPVSRVYREGKEWLA